ncbi:MAG: Ig-like domain-containing protein [Planctomycetota bacterium]|nr:Ig-like domain-containing protein [Planctomycetota bacterium]MDA1112764.1 Ig-like domain-containing protein [Planctomycetota bacterium]
MQASLTKNILSRILPSLSLLLCLGLFAGTCSTGNPGTAFSPTDPGGGDIPPREDGPSTAPVAGAFLADGRPQMDAVAPVDRAKEIDIHTPIVLWFSESIRSDTVTAASLILRPVVTPEFPITTELTWLAGNRCLVLSPVTFLSPNTQFEIVATDNITDLDGERIQLASNGRLSRFTTSSSFAGQAPIVIGAFPPAGSTGIPNDAPVIVAFSKAMDFTGITGAVSLTNSTDSAPGNFDLTADGEFRHAGNRVFEFPHLDDADDLGATLVLNVNTSITDSEFVPRPLATAFASTWDTLAFGRPTSIEFNLANFGIFEPAVNLANQEAFPVRVVTPVAVQPTDVVHLLVHENNDSESVESTRAAGIGIINFSLNLTDSAGGAVFGASSSLILAGYVERDGLRSSVQVLRDAEGLETTVAHDLVRPLLFTYGPPAGQFGSQFVTDLPRFRPYGRGSEPIAQIDSSFPPTILSKARTMPEPPASNFFVGPFFDPLVVTEGPLLFDITLTDEAGNPASFPSPGSVAFRGFLGMSMLSGSGSDLRVVAFDRDALFTIGGATVHVEDFGGGNEDFGSTGSNGSFTFANRSGPQTITVQAFGFDTVSVVGFNTTEISVPMPGATPLIASAGPQISGLTSGLLDVTSNLFVNLEGNLDASAVQNFDIENLFGSVTSRLNRLGWYAAFHNVEDFDAPNRYFRFFGVDSRVLLEPSSNSAAIPPVFPMVESTNQIATGTDFIYPLRVSPGAGFGGITDSHALVGSVIPGVPGFIGLGAGSVDLSGGGVNGDAELELTLHDLAVIEGASSTDVILHVFAEDASDNQGLARVVAPLAAAPADVFLTLPDVPTDGVWSSTGAYPFAHSFTNTLIGSRGFYRLTVEDTAAEPGRWHFWVAASVSSVDPLVLGFPSLRESPADPIGTPPLEMDPGGSWSATVEAFEMPVGFLELAFFFTELERDAISWAKSAVGPSLDF